MSYHYDADARPDYYPTEDNITAVQIAGSGWFRVDPLTFMVTDFAIYDGPTSAATKPVPGFQFRAAGALVSGPLTSIQAVEHEVKS